MLNAVLNLYSHSYFLPLLPFKKYFMYYLNFRNNKNLLEGVLFFEEL